MPTERDQEQDSSSSSSFPPGFHAILEAQKNTILSALGSQIQGLQSNLRKAQSQIASEVQPENYVFKKKVNERQFNFNRKVIRTSSAAVKALENGNIGKAKEELNEGVSLLSSRQKIIKLADKFEFGSATVQEYVCDDLADDEADASKIKKAEKRAAAKFKSLQEKKRRTNAKFSTSAPSPNNASRFTGPSGFSFPPTATYFRPHARSILWKHFQRLRFVFSMWEERSLSQFLPL